MFEGSHTGTISHSASDGGYDGVAIASVSCIAGTPRRPWAGRPPPPSGLNSLPPAYFFLPVLCIEYS